jgi:hypothetical protein
MTESITSAAVDPAASPPGGPQPSGDGKPPGVAADAVIVGDLVCRRCDYNLRTISSAGRCPECGEPVNSSLAAFGEVGTDCFKWMSRVVLYSVFVGSPLLFLGIGAVVLIVGNGLLLWAYRRFTKKTRPVLPRELQDVFALTAGMSFVVLALLAASGAAVLLLSFRYLRTEQALPAALVAAALAMVVPFVQELVFARSCRRLLRSAPPGESIRRTHESIVKMILGGVIGVGGAVMMAGVLQYVLFLRGTARPESAAAWSAALALLFVPAGMWVVGAVEHATTALKSAMQWQRYVTGRGDTGALGL